METLRKNTGVATMDEPDDPWMSIPRAARALGVANATVSKLALRGDLRVQSVDGRIFVHRESVSEYLSRRNAAE